MEITSEEMTDGEITSDEIPNVETQNEKTPNDKKAVPQVKSPDRAAFFSTNQASLEARYAY
ncbi:hypothetical protein J21TS7_48850 [Paenibacillus cineris]|uniref:Uncharacterized protein n=1 Tax=Paenibacillus cineris TaxID=237530 RepID=A0ABQ4LJD3_9BACL|nr:hypothetical protein J21TS7_48850 [Paenibacillus cineris]